MDTQIARVVEDPGRFEGILIRKLQKAAGPIYLAVNTNKYLNLLIEILKFTIYLYLVVRPTRHLSNNKKKIYIFM